MVFPSWQILTFALLYVFPSLLHWPIIFPVISPPILILWHLWSSKVKNYAYSATFDSEPTCSLQNARKTECNILSFAHRLESCPYFRSFTIFQMYKKMLNGRKLPFQHTVNIICPYIHSGFVLMPNTINTTVELGMLRSAMRWYTLDLKEEF